MEASAEYSSAIHLNTSVSRLRESPGFSSNEMVDPGSKGIRLEEPRRQAVNPGLVMIR